MNHEQQEIKTVLQSSALYWDRFEVTFKIFRFMGYIPFKSSEDNQNIGSSFQAWFWAGFVSLCNLAIVVMNDYMRSEDQYWDTYDKTLESFLRLLFTNNVIFILSFWWENNKIINYANSWKQFISRLERTSLTPVTCFSRESFTIVLICAGVISLACILVDQFTLQGGFHLLLLFPYFISVFASAHFMLFWAANCLFIVQVARCFKNNLLEVLKTTSDPSLLDKYRLLWLELQSNTVYFPEALKGCIGLQIFVSMVTLVFALYTWMTTALFANDTIRIVGFLVPILWNVVVLMVICESSDWVSQEIGTKLLSKMLLVRMSTSNISSTAQTEEIDSLFDMFDGKPPDFVIHGCLILNRGLLFTMISSVVTYIIVLVQFDKT